MREFGRHYIVRQIHKRRTKKKENEEKETNEHDSVEQHLAIKRRMLGAASLSIRNVLYVCGFGNTIEILVVKKNTQT